MTQAESPKVQTIPAMYYKYMTVGAARAVVRTGKLQWSSPLCFNDPHDVRTDLDVGVDANQLRATLVHEIMLLIFDDEFFSNNQQLSRTIANFVYKHRKLRTCRYLVQKEIEEELVASLSNGCGPMEAYKSEWHQWLRSARALCLSEHWDSMLMWSHYGKDHRGVVLGLRPNEKTDSFWTCLRKVEYAHRVPALFSEGDWKRRIIYGKGEDSTDAFDRSLCTKAACWEYEQEWRVMREPKFDAYKGTDLIPFDPNDLCEVYLGCRMDSAEKEKLCRLLDGRYPNLKIFDVVPCRDEFALRRNRIDLLK
jgi:hypothetical protein